MDIKVLEEKENSIKLLIKGTNAAFVNGLRRQIMAGTPVLAIEDVHIYDNNGTMYDEMLVQRLGLIPLKMDKKAYKEGDTVKLVLEKEGPGNVYSRDIKSTDPKIEPANPDILITKLAEDQRVKMEMDALVSKGSEHSKWQPAIVSYIEMPSLVSDKGKAYKADMLDIILDENKRDIIPEKNQKVEYDPTAYVFTIDSHGNMSPKELLESAVEELKKKGDDFEKELKNLS